MEDLAALRDHYKAELRAKLEVKVARQRKEREERKALEEAEQRKLKEKVYLLLHNYTFCRREGEYMEWYHRQKYCLF